jgi:chemotaxis protein CheC
MAEKMDEFKIDGLREVANIGCGHAATAISNLLGKKVMMSVPEVFIGDVEEVFEKITGESEEEVIGVLLYFLGDLTGLTLLLLSKKEALELLTLLMREKISKITEDEESALKEVSNIITGAYMTALSDFLGLLALPSVPFLKIDLPKTIISDAFLHIEAHEGFALCIRSLLRIENGLTINATFLFLPDEPAVSLITERLKALLE